MKGKTENNTHPNKYIILDYGIIYRGQSYIAVVFQKRLFKCLCSFWPP